MCNLYSITTNQAAIAALFRVVNRRRQAAADAGRISRLSDTDRAQWSRRTRARHGAMGMPSSQFALMQATKKRAAKLETKGKPVNFKELLRMEPKGGTTNIRKQANEQPERWHIHYAGVRVGLIQQRSGAPPSSSFDPTGLRTPQFQKQTGTIHGWTA